MTLSRFFKSTIGTKPNSRMPTREFAFGGVRLRTIQKAFLSALRNEPIAPQNLKDFVFQPLEVSLTASTRVYSKGSVKRKSRFGRQKYFDTITGIAECQDVLSSLRAVTFLSEGSVWRMCANPKCDYVLFKPARPNQVYHDAACTHRAMANRQAKKLGRQIKKGGESLSVYLRGNVYWMDFVFDGKRIQRSTSKETDKSHWMRKSNEDRLVARSCLNLIQSHRRRLRHSHDSTIVGTP